VKNAVTFEYMDLCKVCLEDVRPFTKLIERKDLITTEDIEIDCEDFDADMDSKPSLEDFDDIMIYREVSRGYDD